ncbi:MAG: DAPG hydrolase family protein [Beijerinckiaceae bacterium]
MSPANTLPAFEPFADIPAYPSTRAKPAIPWPAPYALKGFGSARTGIERLPDGRTSYWIVHDIVRGVTPAMLAWWFANLEGDVDIEGCKVNRYRAWHPYDHVHASYAWRRPDGTVGPGAAIRLREYLGANARFEVNITTLIEKLDETGFVHNPVVHGVSGFARMEYAFHAVEGGTRYENCLIVGGASGWRRLLTPLAERFFNKERGVAWLRHNIEEVGALERFLPELYRREYSRSQAHRAAERLRASVSDRRICPEFAKQNLGDNR